MPPDLVDTVGAGDPEIGGRGASGAFVLDSIEERQRFLVTLTR
jgi:hypothetical protein